MRRVTEYTAARRHRPAVGILLNNGRVVSHPLRPAGFAGDMKRFLTRLANKA